MRHIEKLRLDARGAAIGLNTITARLRVEVARYNEQLQSARQHTCALVSALETEWAERDNAGETGPAMDALNLEISLLHAFLEDPTIEAIHAPHYADIIPGAQKAEDRTHIGCPKQPGGRNALNENPAL